MIKANLSPFALGAGQFGTGIPRDAAFAMLDRFVELGGNFVDTARVYGDWVPSAPRGASERVIGDWIRTRTYRANIFIGTKGAHPDIETMQIPRVTAADIRFDIDSSLANLQSDYIDLYWLHRDNPAIPVEELVEALEAARAAGKVREYGYSNWSPARIAEANAYAASFGVTGCFADQVMWNAAVLVGKPYGDPTLEAMTPERYAMHLATGVAQVPYNPQAGGLFHKLDKMLPISESVWKTYAKEATMERFNRMRGVVQQRGCTMTQAVLGYLRGRPFPVIPILGCKSIEQLEDSFTASNFMLSAEEIAFVEG